MGRGDPWVSQQMSKLDPLLIYNCEGGFLVNVGGPAEGNASQILSRTRARSLFITLVS